VFGKIFASLAREEQTPDWRRAATRISMRSVITVQADN
jgi:hypothetical protein